LHFSPHVPRRRSGFSLSPNAAIEVLPRKLIIGIAFAVH